MSVIGALKRSLTIIRDNPIILGVTFILALFGIPSIAMQGIPLEFVLSLLPRMFLYMLPGVLVAPFFMAGVFGMAGEARKTGATSISTFIREGKRNYVRLLLGYVLFIIIAGVAAGISFGGIFIAPIILRPLPPIVALAAMIVMAIAMPLIPVVVLIFIQFYDVGIVLSGYGVVESFKKSFGFVRSRFVSAVGYSALRMFILFVLTTPSFMTTLPVTQNVLIVANLLFTTLGAILYTFHAVFYAEYALGAT